MPGADKKGGKKGTKLSLTKKTQKGETSSVQRNAGIRNLLEGKVDLNETCEFKQPLKFPGCGDNKVKVENDKKSEMVTKITKVKVSDKSCEEREEAVRCQVCNKNLSHMNVHRREQHVNKCIDKVEDVEKKQKEEQLLLEAARTAVLDCPMCGQRFKAENARLVHLKKCSQNVGVSTEKMIHLVKDQEQERQQQLAAGIVPKELRSKVTKSAAPKKRKLKEPKSQYEEDVQVAMAISSSLTSAGDIVKDAKRKKNKKAVLEDVCLLITLTDEDRHRRMEEKVSHILHMANSTKYSEELLLLESNMKADFQHAGCSLWDRCRQDPVTGDNNQFYVGALVPPLSVSKSVPGTNLRRLSSIPGRETSFAKKSDAIPGKCSAGSSDLPADDIITASTQTAVVLAELAVDDTDILDTTVGSQLTPDPQNTDCIADLQASGFCVEKMVLNKSDQDIQVSQTLLDYRRLINNKEYSDVTVISCSGQSFFAHQLILAARCPKLLQMMTDSAIRLEIPPDIVLSFLNYIYTGDVTLTSSSQTELQKLAKQLELPSLIDACSKVVVQTETSETVDLNDDQESSETEFIESHLDMKEIWGESDSDLDLDKGDQSGERESRSDSGINDDDYREISFTQNCRIRERIPQGPDDVRQSHSKSKHLIDNDFSQNCAGASDSNEIPNKLTIHQSDEAGCESSSLRKSYSSGKERDKSAVHNESPEVDNNYEMNEDLDKEKDGNSEVMDVDLDSDASPSPKRLRLSSETEDVKKRIESENSVNRFSDKNVKNSVCEENGDFNGFKHNLKHVNDVIDVDEETVDNTSTGINSSTADLFGSPSPRKSDVTVAGTVRGTVEISSYKHNLQSSSNFSTPLEHKTDLRRTFSRGSLPVTPVVSVDIDSDSSLEDLANLNECTGNSCDKDQIENAEQKVINISTSSSLVDNDEQTANSIENQKENVDTKADKNASDYDVDRTELNVESSDDDLQITGDNFNELTQQSPTFSLHKTSSIVNRVSDPGETTLETKYLGLKSFTEVLSNQKQSSNDNGYVERHLKFSRNVKHKHLADSASDGEEIVTIQTEDSDICDEDEREVKEIDTVDNEAEHNQSNYSDKNESNFTRSLIKDGRKSTAYGKHEVSVYSGDEDNVNTHNSSFGASNADVWEDFDDCGMGYEPPDIGAGETSPVAGYELPNKSPEGNSPLTGYEQQEESAGEMSPVIPKQDEVIDLSQNEDDNNIHDGQIDSDLDGALLEDGDDSFVFKVNDQPETSEKPSMKTLETKNVNFETPTVLENAEKKKSAWAPPSPFTPMPQYGEMQTPALKKAVQKYGVKPVGKKRMIKVLEDIYHQTHQYETDSECEVEGDTATDTAPGLTGGLTGAGDSLPSSQGDMSSQDSDISDVLEESCLHMMSSDSDTTGSPQKNVDVTRQLFDFIKSNPEIHTKILMYEPLELDVLKKAVKDAGIKCSMDKLINFLDERCIAFTSKNSRKRQTGKRGKQKATKSKQTEK